MYSGKENTEGAVYWALRNIVSDARGNSGGGVTIGQLRKYGQNRGFFSKNFEFLPAYLRDLEKMGAVGSEPRGKEKIWFPGGWAEDIDWDTEIGYED